jgi:hypothetical protein
MHGPRVQQCLHPPSSRVEQPQPDIPPCQNFQNTFTSLPLLCSRSLSRLLVLTSFYPTENQTKIFRVSVKILCSAQLRCLPSRLLSIPARVSRGSPGHPSFPLQNFFSVLWIQNHLPSILKTAGERAGKYRHVQAAPARLQCGLSPPHILLSHS